MQIESALIARARPQILAARLREVIQPEIQKGCDPAIATVPVALEPRFSPLWMSLANSSRSDVSDWVPEAPISSDQWVNLRVWISTEHSLDWNQSELFIKLLQGLTYRCAFQISGNRRGVILAFRVHQQDVAFFKAVFKGAYGGCELARQAQISSCTSSGVRSMGIQFRDFYPPPPYSHLLTRPPELQKSPLQPLITTLADMEPSNVGVYQLVFQPVFTEHNWHQNVQILLDIEYNVKLNHGMAPGSSYTHQSPSGDLKQMAWEVENKAHNDKPFFSVALRVGVVGAGEGADTVLDGLSAFVALFQHGGRPLAYLTEQDYTSVIGHESLGKLFEELRSHRPGFLTNSQELTGLVHLPPAAGIDENELPTIS